MAITYQNLRVELAKQGKKMSDIHRDLGISWTSLTKINKDQYISLRILEDIALYLDCDIGDLVNIKK